jgi:GT2 family glycosyltransferase
VCLSVVIATRDRAAFLDRALGSLRDQHASRPFEVVVADNGSSDATQDVLDRWTARVEFPLHRVFEAEPNRGKARNAALARAAGDLILFIDDDVLLPGDFINAHLAAHEKRGKPHAVSGPILNVPSYDVRPKPGALNYSGAFFCTCNVSVPRSALLAAGAFDPRFNLYGWEDTELGLRLRRSGVRRRFAWDAYLWHIKPPDCETFERRLQKSVEKGRMAARFLAREGGWRARLATGGHPLNLLRAQLTTPDFLMPWLAGLAVSDRVPSPLRALAESAALDGAYARELRERLGEQG